MTLTDEQTTTVLRWLAEHWHGKARCPTGHDDGWSAEDTMSYMPGFVADAGGPRIVHERGFRFVVLTCDQCGYVGLLNSKVVGVAI
jgi:hypothetical protein